LSIHFQSEWADVKIYYILISINKKKTILQQKQKSTTFKQSFWGKQKTRRRNDTKMGKKEISIFFS